MRNVVRRACGSGGAGAIAWRSLLTRFRTPRTALETFTGAGVGLAAVLVPTLLRDAPGSGAVLVGGAIQLAVLFMSGNSFGTDGPRAHARAARRRRAFDARPRQGPQHRHRRLPPGRDRPRAGGRDHGGVASTSPAGFLVGGGALLAGTGAAIVQSALVPIAIPESDNPFASGESGKG